MKIKTRGITVYHLLLALPVLFVLALTIFPMAYAVAISFTNWHLGVPEYSFVGLRNYLSAFADYRFYNSSRIIFMITAVAVPIEIVLGLIIAVLMSMEIRFQKIFRAMLLIPLFTAPVAVGLMGEVVLYEAGGPVNGYLKLLGLPQVPWRSDANIAPWTVVMWDVWMWAPFCFLISLAGIQAIPKELFEAASVDGAGGFFIFRKITLPMLKYFLVTISMFRIVDCLRIFEVPFVMIGGGGPGIATETLTIYIYKIGFRGFAFGDASSLSLLFLIMILIVMTLFIRRVRGFYA